MPAAQTWIILLLWSTEPNDFPAWTKTSGSEMPLKLSHGNELGSGSQHGPDA